MAHYYIVKNSISTMVARTQREHYTQEYRITWVGAFINPRRKAWAEGYCNHLAISVCPSVCPCVHRKRDDAIGVVCSIPHAYSARAELIHLIPYGYSTVSRDRLHGLIPYAQSWCVTGTANRTMKCCLIEPCSSSFER